MDALTIYKFCIKCTIVWTVRPTICWNLFHTVFVATLSAKPADRIGSSLIAFHGISSKRQLHLQVRESGYLHPCGTQQIPCEHFPGVFSTLPNSQTHCYIDSTLACADLPLIIPWLYFIYPLCHN